jgi:hypothetical protein
MVSVHECAPKGGCHPLCGGVLMVVIMSWSMSWHHCSAIDDEVCGGGGLLSS